MPLEQGILCEIAEMESYKRIIAAIPIKETVVEEDIGEFDGLVAGIIPKIEVDLADEIEMEVGYFNLFKTSNSKNHCAGHVDDGGVLQN